MQSDPETWQRDETPKSFQNPMAAVFTTSRRDDANHLEEYFLHPFQIVTYPTYLADFLIAHLTDAVIEERGLGYVTPEERAALVAEILTIDGQPESTD